MRMMISFSSGRGGVSADRQGWRMGWRDDRPVAGRRLIALLVGIAASTWITKTSPEVARQSAGG
jgi:hypothetical protein